MGICFGRGLKFICLCWYEIDIKQETISDKQYKPSMPNSIWCEARGGGGVNKVFEKFFGLNCKFNFFFKKSKSKKIASCLQVLQTRDGHDQIPLLKYMWSIQQQN